jgi:hypothetical protein
MMRFLRRAVLVVALVTSLPAVAEDQLPDTAATPTAESDAAAAQAELDAIGEAMANPLSYLWLMFTQNDLIWPDGDLLDDLDLDAKPQNVFMLSPVLSMQLTENWKTIFRPVIPIVSYNTLDNVNFSTSSPTSFTGIDRSRSSGLGDIVLWTAFSKQYTPPIIWGFGPTMMLNTATDDQLGTGKYSMGPMALGFYLTDKWILGTIAQHWQSFAGEDNISISTTLGNVKVDRPDVSLTDVQVVIRYRVSALTNIGMAPNWRYNWETNELDLPLGGGFDTLIKIGPLPVKVGLEAYYHVVREDKFGPEWQLRFLFIPVLPSPKWARKPLF